MAARSSHAMYDIDKSDGSLFDYEIHPNEYY